MQTKVKYKSCFLFNQYNKMSSSGVGTLSTTMETCTFKMDLYHHMNKFMQTYRCYTHSELPSKTLMLEMNHSLELITPSADDDTTNRIYKYFLTDLYGMMTKIDTHCPAVWSAVNILTAMDPDVVRPYKFIRPLTRFLTDGLTKDRKLTLLSLLKTLSYKSHVSWTDCYAEELIETLVRWIAESDKQIAHASLAVVGNLCYKSATAQYMLMRTTDIQAFLERIVCFESHVVLHVGQILAALAQRRDSSSNNRIHRYIGWAFGFLANPAAGDSEKSTREFIDFFRDIKRDNPVSFQTYANYQADFKCLIDAVNSNNAQASLIMEFFAIIIDVDHRDIRDARPFMMKVAAESLHTSPTASGLTLFKAILSTDVEIDAQLMSLTMPRLASALENATIPNNAALILTIFRLSCDKIDIDEFINERVMEQCFAMKARNVHVHALALLATLTRVNAKWADVFKRSMELRMATIALAFNTFNVETKRVLFELMKCNEFDAGRFAESFDTHDTGVNQREVYVDAGPFFMMSHAQEMNINELLLKGNRKESDITRLYEAKVDRLQFENRQYRNALKQSVATVGDLTEGLARMELESRDFHEQVLKLQMISEELKTNLATSREQARKYEAELRESATKTNEWLEQYRLAYSQNQIKCKELIAVEEKCGRLTNELKDLSEEAKMKDGIIAKMEEKLIKMGRSLEKGEAKIVKLQEEKDNILTSLNEQKQELAAKAEMYHALQQENEELQQRLDKIYGVFQFKNTS